MRQKQFLILSIGVLLFALSELFPPWLYEDERTSVVRSAGYHFISGPPKLKSPSEMRRIFELPDSAPTKFMWAHRDPGRLLAQRATIALLTIGSLILSLRSKRLLIRILGGAVIGFGFLCLILLCCYVFVFLH